MLTDADDSISGTSSRKVAILRNCLRTCWKSDRQHLLLLLIVVIYASLTSDYVECHSLSQSLSVNYVVFTRLDLQE